MLDAVSMTKLITDQLSLVIDRKSLLDDVSVSLESDTLTVIMGQNGAGKSVLIRLLHGLLQPTSGSISWSGHLINEQVRARQAMVFQRPVLLRRSVAANLDFVLDLKGTPPGQTRDSLLELVGLQDRASLPARLLSGGEQQRLALARAIATNPDVIFLDEPTASLDPASVLLIEDIVKQAQAGGTKIIFITHDLGQARRLADDIVFLHQGRLEEHTPAARFFDSTKSNVAQDYLAGKITV
ncbi:MAG: ATP-binding cassette domain-containing protein [Granulosicoccus sp.]|nr:ATP-binding cassette domain-containing protein [Granulosicoccus sp.]